MQNVKMSELERGDPKNENLLLVLDMTVHKSKTITIGQLLGMQQEALNKPCQHCGSRGKYDIRGNCGACGAPIE
jgi:hypothetical protein